ncbi:uncharacterized protein LOC110698001 [Chenopodium quinoa]|uniref:uncharacterized protein LOC110698001 n=1 Tax=Chenopodium quinoa TaxID=63459 RepID=UPI000B777864|nr:uncharacterized protein LOC110698001 [Chenopodium quinoa]
MIAQYFKTTSSPSSRVLLPCSTTSDSNILLIGGELQNPSSPYCSTHASREVYKLIPEVSGPNGDIKNIRIELADATIPRMKSGKACPIVEEIGDSCSLGFRMVVLFCTLAWLADCSA